MNIQSQHIYVQSDNNPSFKAVPLAKYSSLRGKEKDIIVYKLEKSDVNFLNYISQNIEKFYKKHGIEDWSTKQVLSESINAGIHILQNDLENKADVLLAMVEDAPSAILIGNVLKRDARGNLHYSSRKNQAKNETELDWLSTWNKNILGEGKVIVCEFFRRLIKNGFKQVYVRSEVPDKSFALEFYKKMGFEPLSNKQRRLQTKTDSSYLIGEFDDSKDMIVPMKATIKDIWRVLKKRSKEFERTEFNTPISVDLSAIDMQL